ncbi:MAG: hypothetical protein E7531_06345 [Ruminococcaceae bacterium]|nr:hypothetical protein [Oscillospiraceae bacterium]
MKKLISVALIVLALLSCLTACSFTQNMSGVLAGDAECTPKVEEMLSVLAENNTSDAKALMHPQSSDKSDAAIEQMSTYLAGREADSMELQNINVSTSTGTSGRTSQEQVSYRVNLSDGEVIYLNVVYLSNKDGTGFASFQIVLGVV